MPSCPKLAILSHVLPPAPSGQAIVLHRLLRDLNPDHYCLLSVRDRQQASESASAPLPGKFYRLPVRTYFQGRLWRRAEPIRGAASLALQVWQRARALVCILRREQCQALIACTGELIDLPAGCLAARRLRVPFYVYLFDDYVQQWTQRSRRAFAWLAAPWILRSAAGVVAPNEFLADAYRRRYGVEPVVIHNAAEVQPLPVLPWPAEAGGVKLLYTGAVYDAQVDAIRNLSAALQHLPRDDVRLYLYTSASRPVLQEQGIAGRVVVREHVPLEQALRLQQTADILFLPLAFRSPYPDVVRTSAPGKLGEYLAAGRPILAHVPGDSFVAWYLRKHECGVVVDEPDPSQLSAAVARLCASAALRARLTSNALARARADFAVEQAQSRLLGLVQGRQRLRAAC